MVRVEEFETGLMGSGFEVTDPKMHQNLCPIGVVKLQSGGTTVWSDQLGAELMESSSKMGRSRESSKSP